LCSRHRREVRSVLGSFPASCNSDLATGLRAGYRKTFRTKCIGAARRMMRVVLGTTAGVATPSRVKRRAATRWENRVVEPSCDRETSELKAASEGSSSRQGAKGRAVQGDEHQASRDTAGVVASEAFCGEKPRYLKKATEARISVLQREPIKQRECHRAPQTHGGGVTDPGVCTPEGRRWPPGPPHTKQGN